MLKDFPACRQPWFVVNDKGPQLWGRGKAGSYRGEA